LLERRLQQSRCESQQFESYLKRALDDAWRLTCSATIAIIKMFVKW
jgi:hypothetical protein